MKEKYLHNKKLGSGFKTPEEYFDIFENRLFEKLQNNVSISLPEKEGFKIPDHYFDTFEGRLFDRLPKEEKDPVKVVALHSYKAYYRFIGYAAAAVILFMVIFNTMPSNPGEDDLFTTIASSEISAFIEQDLIAMNDYDMMDIYEEEDIDISTLFEVTLNDTETIEYLENTIDLYDDIPLE